MSSTNSPFTIHIYRVLYYFLLSFKIFSKHFAADRAECKNIRVIFRNLLTIIKRTFLTYEKKMREIKYLRKIQYLRKIKYLREKNELYSNNLRNITWIRIMWKIDFFSYQLIGRFSEHFETRQTCCLCATQINA